MSDGESKRNRESERVRKQRRKHTVSCIFSCLCFCCVLYRLISIAFDIFRFEFFEIFPRSHFCSLSLSHSRTQFFSSRCVFIMGNAGFFMNGFLLSINIRANQSFFACVRPTNCDLHIYKYSENTEHMAKVRWVRVRMCLCTTYNMDANQCYTNSCHAEHTHAEVSYNRYKYRMVLCVCVRAPPFAQQNNAKRREKRCNGE